MRKVNILETTLRDGSYAINFSFTSTDTSIICKELEEAGFEYIEIGHGVGLNASNRGYGNAAETDEDYMIAADSALKKSKYGMFCIPGIAKIEDIDKAAEHNMGFIRIGTNVTEVKDSTEYIKRAKDHGMFVAANYMKSYALPPEKFAEKVAISEKAGADLVYIVDSAGGMFRENIKEYYDGIRKYSNIQIGFHGHDNLGLGVSNSIEALEMGIDFVDSSLQGLGRSSGNACTEILVMALMKKGYELNIDYLKTLDIGQQYIQPLITSRGKMVLDIIAGYADFHSSFMHYVQRYSAKYNINPVSLIIEIGKVNKIQVNDKLMDEVCQKLTKNKNIYLGKYEFNRYVGNEQDER
nr:hypothetical protein [uncultured Methanolobus sp.]